MEGPFGFILLGVVRKTADLQGGGGSGNGIEIVLNLFKTEQSKDRDLGAVRAYLCQLIHVIGNVSTSNLQRQNISIQFCHILLYRGQLLVDSIEFLANVILQGIVLGDQSLQLGDF